MKRFLRKVRLRLHFVDNMFKGWVMFVKIETGRNVCGESLYCTTNQSRKEGFFPHHSNSIEDVGTTSDQQFQDK